MLKWQKKYAGCYVTKCGTFKAQDGWQDCGFGTTRYWELSCTDSRFTLTIWNNITDSDLVYGSIHDTLKQAKYVAGLIQEKRLAELLESLTPSGA